MNRIASIAGAIGLAAVLSGAAAAQSIEACTDRSDLDRQIDACSHLIENDATSDNERFAALVYRCQARDMKGDPVRAVTDCEAAARLRPRSGPLQNSLNIVYLNLGRAQDGLAAANRALDIDPRDGGYINARANAYCALGSHAEAYQDRLAALERGRFEPKGLQQLLQARGFYSGAIDGQFGPKSRAALRAWSEAGCP